MMALRSILAWFVSLLYTFLPTVKDPDSVRKRWEKRKGSAVRSLGTVKEARQLLSQIGREGESVTGLLRLLEEHCNSKVKVIGEEEPVGDPKDVHYVIPPRHAVGYSIETSRDGYTLEIIETHRLIVTVLRCRNVMVGRYLSGIIRQESYGGIHVI